MDAIDQAALDELKEAGAVIRETLVANARASRDASDETIEAAKEDDRRAGLKDVPDDTTPARIQLPMTLAQARAVRAAEANAITPDEIDKFLITLATRGVWNFAAYSVGRSGAAFRKMANEDPCFAVRVEEAAQTYREGVQGEIFRRAMVGWDEPICGKDSVICHVRRFSDRLIELEAKACWPARYRDNHAVGDDQHRGGVLVVGETMAPGEWDKRAAIALQRVTDEPEAVPKLTRPVKPSD